MENKKRKKTPKFKPLQLVREELYSNGWQNDTLSPLSTKPYWEMVRNIIKEDETVLSALFATSSSFSILRKSYVFIVTNKRIVYVAKFADIVSKPKTLRFANVREIKLWQDIYLASRIYVDLYVNNFSTFRLETADPTSTLHFKNTIALLRKKKFKI